MPYLRDYHIMISHSWKYSKHYDKVCQWLNDTRYFKWSNYSVCCDNPLSTNTDKELENELEERISRSSCIIVLSGMYVNYSKWINFEIDTAISIGKPIIGVKPWGQERVPEKVQESSDILAGWNSESIIDAVRKYAL